MTKQVSNTLLEELTLFFQRNIDDDKFATLTTFPADVRAMSGQLSARPFTFDVLQVQAFDSAFMASNVRL